MAVSFDAYKVFYITARSGSITAAAKELFVTQPTVTHCIQKIEEDLGCVLFIRGKKGVELTKEGKILYKHIKLACEEIWAAENYITQLKKFENGEIVVGASEMTLHHFLMPYLKLFKESYPKIKMKIHNVNTTDMIDIIKNNEIDCGISAFPCGYKESGLVIKPLDTFQDIVIAGNEYRELLDNKIHLKELERYPIIGLEKGTLTSTTLRELFKKYGTTLKTDIELATSDLIVPAVANGLGIGFVPEAFALEAIKRGKVYKLDILENIPQRSICLVYKVDKPQPRSVKAFINCVQKKLQTIN